ncbi:MAG: 8-amino-7-oxononanoate synthase [Candidatus Hydrogenedentes bacterium]|nr:8-amino-7-oxononanoate synthase [Candidatus Hydrogenedentota bacterium]
MKSYKKHLEQALDEIREAGRWRQLNPAPQVGGTYQHGDACWLNFSSNDYLDLARHPSVREGAMEAVEKYGGGATGSRLMAGDLDLHHALEQRLARLTGHEQALVFPSGYQTNIAVMSSLTIPGDAIFSDALNHASIIDGIRLSRASAQIYRHRDMEHLESLLEKCRHAPKRIIVSDAVFSMDGTVAPVETLAELAHAYDAMLVVDEAHALGIWGQGGGLCRELGVQPDVIIGTLGKSLGSAGGFAASSSLIRDCLVNRGRSFIYTTGLLPAAVGAAMGALDAIAEDPALGVRLLERSELFRAVLRETGIEPGGEGTQIFPILVGDDETAVSIARALQDDGMIVTGIRPPTVPAGTSRLRLSVTLAHEEASFRRVALALAGLLPVMKEG